MPGLIGNYSPIATAPAEAPVPQLTNTLACKVVTACPANVSRTPPLHSTNATILLFDPTTGLPKAILGGTEITTWRTVAATLVATKHLWFGRHTNLTAQPQLAIIGTGVQGRFHAIGFLNNFNFASVHLWNRTRSKALRLAAELRATFGVVNVIVAETVEECVKDADVILTATYSGEPLVDAGMLKAGVHINGA